MADTATLSRQGLFTTAGAAVPLAGVSIDADISNLSARVVVAQRYVNTEAAPIEATYLFPLDESSAVCGFEAIVDGTLVVGEVKPREEAFEAYDDAMARGDGAFLLDEERPDVFQASVGNLPPGGEALLKITYITELSVDAGSIRFVVPTTVSPRYAPDEDRRGVGRPDAETLNPPVMWTVPYGFTLAARIAMSGRPGQVASPSHPIAVALDGDDATVTLAQREMALDRDFVLTIAAAALDTPQAWLERGEDGTEAVAVAFAPLLPDAQSPAEVIFLVDRSGSMQGASIREVRNALQLCLRSLVAGCRFNIIGFGSTTVALFPEARDYDDDSLRAASEHVARLDADLGGTEILTALRKALEAPARGELPRQVVVLTDGEVTNTDAVIALAASHAERARIFTFGIGAGASHHLVKGLARAGRGSAEFIYPGERIEPKVVRQLGRLLSPALANVRVDWGGLDVTQAPTSPPVFSGGRVVVYGFLRRPIDAPATVRLTADRPDGPAAFDVLLDPAAARQGTAVATLAARARIRELEESPEFLRSRGSRQRERKSAGAAREVVELALRYGLVSRETSYVAIERREAPVTGDVQLRRVPIALTTGWGGVDRPVQPTAAPLAAPYAAYDGLALRASYSLDGGEAEPMEQVSFSRAEPPSFKERLSSWLGGPRRSSVREDPLYQRMLALTALQRADGAWDLSSEFLDLIEVDPAGPRDVLRGWRGEPAEGERALATALALRWLERAAGPFEGEWRLLARKGHDWLHRQSYRQEWLSAAGRLLSQGGSRL